MMKKRNSEITLKQIKWGIFDQNFSKIEIKK